MFFAVSKLFEFFGSPSHVAIFMATLGAALLFTRFFRAARALATLAAALLFSFAFLPVGNFLAAPLEARFPEPPEDMPAPDGIIVLGGSVNEYLSALREGRRTVFVGAAERLTAPLALLKRYPQARLIFSGGSANVAYSGVSEAATVQRLWRSLGVDDSAALYEGKSRNTWENAVFTRDLAQPKPGERWLLVTSATHMPRSVGIFRQVGFPVIPYPVDFRTDGNMWRFSTPRFTGQAIELVDLAVHEWLGLAIYRLTGKSAAFLPAPEEPR